MDEQMPACDRGTAMRGRYIHETNQSHGQREDEIEAVIPNLSWRYSGGTATNQAIAPGLARLLQLVGLGPDRPRGVARLTLRDLLRLRARRPSPYAPGAVGLIVGAISWSIASALARKLPLPASKVMSSGAQMLAGGAMLLAVSAARGEWRGFDPFAVSGAAWMALVYLVFAGSIAGFTAYVWLLHHQSPTKVGTYAYVNPVVAVIIGYFLGGEPLGARTVAGGVFVVASVVMITSMRAKTPAVAEGSE